MKRREFMFSAGAGALALWSGSSRPSNLLAAQAEEKHARIGVSSWSFRNLFTATHDDKAPPISGKPLDARDFPELIADRYHIHNLEIVSPHFISTEASYIREFKERLQKTRSRLLNVPIDIDEFWNAPALSATDPKERQKAVSAYLKWIDIAHDLGARSVRCDPGKVNPADLSPTIESYKTLASHGRSKNIYVIVENHGGFVSQHPEGLANILKAAGSNAGALPDFGNFPDEETRERGLRLLLPLTYTVCHAKLNARFDFARCMKVAQEVGFKGVYSIEAGGQGDPYVAVQKVIDELLKYI